MTSLLNMLLLTVFCGSNGLALSTLPAIHSSATLASSSKTRTEPVRQETELTEASWRRHPKIGAIRRIVNSVDARMKKGSYKLSERKFESCQDQFFTLRQIARDSKGAVAWYKEYYEYEDGSYNFHYYYDPAGRLRFVFASTYAANGTRQQHRIYFDETGKRIWEATRFLKGPGCPGCFPIPYPDEALAHGAAKAFANDEGCKEIKPEPKRRE